MKKTKIIIAVLTLFVLLSSLSIISLAANDTLRIAEDYSYIEYGGEKYVRVKNVSDDVEFVYSEFLSFTIQYTEKQEKEIDGIDLYGDKGFFIRLSLDFISGGTLYEHYVCEDYIDEYNSIASLTSSFYSFYKDGERIFIHRDALFGEGLDMSAGLLMTYRRYGIENTSDIHFCFKYSGDIIVDPDGNCYYLDYAENGTNDTDFSFFNHDTLTVHKITDAELSEILRGEAEPAEKSRVFIYATVVMMGIFFGAFPLALGILCFMKRKGAKEPYRSLYTILMSVCALAVVLLIILAAIVLPYL